MNGIILSGVVILIVVAAALHRKKRTGIEWELSDARKSLIIGRFK